MPSGKIWNGSAFVDPSAYRVWNGSAFAAPNSMWTWNGSSFVKIWPLQVTLDSAGGGTTASGATASWSHTALGAVVVAVRAQSTFGAMTLSVDYGGTPMTQLGSSVSFHSLGQLALFGLLTPPGGSQTITVTTTGGAGVNISTSSVSYLNVSSFGTPATNASGGTSLSLAMSSATGRMVSQAFAANATSGTQGLNLSAYNATLRRTGLISNANMIHGDSVGAASMNFSCVASRAANWAAIGVDLIP